MGNHGWGIDIHGEYYFGGLNYGHYDFHRYNDGPEPHRHTVTPFQYLTLWRQHALGTKNERERWLYNSCLLMSSYGWLLRDEFTCIRWKVPLQGDGWYALTLKSMEPVPYPLPTVSSRDRRAFNIKLADKTVIKDEDLHSLQPAERTAIDVVVNFKISGWSTSTRTMYVNGLGSMDVKLDNDRIKLSICNSECTRQGYGPHFCAFNVVKY